MVDIVYGDDSTFSALSFGVPHHGTVSYLTQRFHQAGEVLGQLGTDLYQRAADLYERYSSEDAIRLAQAALRRVQTAWQPDIVYSMCQIAQFQHAQPTMVRWLMANPTVRQMYHRNEVDGYSDFYVDAEPGAVGEDHYDYRRAMDGLVVLNENPADDEPEWYADIYFDELLPDDGDLTIEDQSFIQNSWENLCSYLAEGEDDPTSRYNAKLT